MTDAVIFSHTVLRDFARDLLEAAGVEAAKAGLVAESLVAANLRGVDSHGVQLLPYYVNQILAGNVDPASEGRVISESGACLAYDGGNGLGQVISAICCDHAIRLAAGGGLGMAVARNSNHFGAAAYWGERISAAGFVGIALCNASPIVPPWQGREGRFGTNPICMSVPGVNARPWLLDMATTTVAKGWIYKAAFAGQTAIPPGWAMDLDGVPTTSTDAAMEGLLMPLGGYKGSGLAMMVEILCGVLGGGTMSTEVGGIRIIERRQGISQTFLAIDVARFLPLEEFRARMDRLAAAVKSTRPAAGYDEVLVAGDPEWRAEQTRRREGVPLQTGVWESLVETARRVGVAPPQPGIE